MREYSRRRIGIVGGMGPAAGNYFAQMITRLTPAEHDQDHATVIHISNPRIPDRTAYLVGRGADPVPEIAATIRQIDAIGADIICIPCNTAHAPQLFVRYQCATTTPIANMIDEAMHTISTQYPTARSIAVLGTDGTKATHGYEYAASAYGYAVVYPAIPAQKRLMDIIYAIKRRGIQMGDSELLTGVTETCHNADIIVLACTELSMLSSGLRARTSTPVVDSLECLAQAALGTRQTDSMHAPIGSNRHGTMPAQMLTDTDSTSKVAN